MSVCATSSRTITTTTTRRQSAAKMPVLSAVKRLSLASISSTMSASTPNKPTAAAASSSKKHDPSDSAFSRRTSSAVPAPGNKMVSYSYTRFYLDTIGFEGNSRHWGNASGLDYGQNHESWGEATFPQKLKAFFDNFYISREVLWKHYLDFLCNNQSV